MIEEGGDIYPAFYFTFMSSGDRSNILGRKIALGKSLKNEEIIDSSKISFVIMHFAEYFLAHLILDRSRRPS
ncbi:MAG: hypothetical protein QXI93_01095 [Candidatus Methanomethylicia archaeon]